MAYPGGSAALEHAQAAGHMRQEVAVVRGAALPFRADPRQGLEQRVLELREQINRIHRLHQQPRLVGVRQGQLDVDIVFSGVSVMAGYSNGVISDRCPWAPMAGETARRLNTAIKSRPVAAGSGQFLWVS